MNPLTLIKSAKAVERSRRCIESRPPRLPRVHPMALLKAIRGSRGNRAVICERLGGITYGTLSRALKRYPNAMELFNEEDQAIIETAKNTIDFNMRQTVNLQVAQRAAEYTLDRRAPEYKPKSTVEHEGGEKPIKTIGVTAGIDLSKVSPDSKRWVLEQLRSGNAVPTEVLAMMGLAPNGV